jgi:hypothetical protein
MVRNAARSEEPVVRSRGCGDCRMEGAGEGVSEKTPGMWAIVRSVRMRARCRRASKGRNAQLQ